MNALAPLLQLPFARPDEPLARHTTMKVGGPARVFVEPQTEIELVAFLEIHAKSGAPLFVLGAGSNIVAGESFEGAVLHLGRGFATQRVEGSHIVAGGAAMLPVLTKFSLANALGNFEWACGVPGSLGGSLWGNAGARGWNGHGFESRDCAADFHSCITYTRDGRRLELGRDDVEFAYRRSSLGDLIVVEATLSLKPLTPEPARESKERVRELLERRRATQPANQASAGCIWKNPDLDGCLGAGALVESLGLKGRALGGAQVSPLHGNFVINAGGASAREIRELVERVEREVLERTGVVLEREARFLESFERAVEG